MYSNVTNYARFSHILGRNLFMSSICVFFFCFWTQKILYSIGNISAEFNFSKLNLNRRNLRKKTNLKIALTGGLTQLSLSCYLFKSLELLMLLLITSAFLCCLSIWLRMVALTENISNKILY